MAEMNLSMNGLLPKEEFHRLADFLLSRSEGEHTFVALTDWDSRTTRFANNQIVQNVDTRRISLAVTVSFGQRHGTATTSDVGEEALIDTLRRAARIARLAPPDPEYLPPLPPQQYAALPTFREETVIAGPDRRAALAREAIELCKAEQLTAAGIVASGVAAVGLAASTRLFAYEARAEARFSVTATRPQSSGWAANVHRSIDRLGVPERTRIAIEKAKQSVNPREIPPGRYTVILEPAAVAGLIGPLIWALDAKSYYRGTSPLQGKFGRPIVDRRLTLRNCPDHPDLLGNGFNGEGLPAAELAWIQGGTLAQLRYDRYTAQEHGVPPSPALDAPCLLAEGDEPVPERVEDLVRNTDRAILVTNFWYIRSVNPTDLTLTGMTRDGTFLVEGGRIVSSTLNFRWHDSPLRVLNQVEAVTRPGDAVSNENWKMRLPAMKLRDFNFTSVTRF